MVDFRILDTTSGLKGYGLLSVELGQAAREQLDRRNVGVGIRSVAYGFPYKSVV
jgi:hypothetical protein